MLKVKGRVVGGIVGFVVVAVVLSGAVLGGAPATLERCNVVWDSVSEDSSGSMPIGNGDIGLNVWVDKAGELVFYISKTDAWSENARLLKLGKVRVRLSPNPFGEGRLFRQSLRLREGEIEIVGGSGGERVTLRVWVDANRPVVRVEAEGQRAFELEAHLEVWRTEQRELKGEEANSARGLTGGNYPIIVYPDVVLPAKDGRIRWYHRNEKSCYAVTLENQHLGELVAKYPDPLMGRTFGGCMKGDGLKAVGDRMLKSSKPGRRFVVSIYPLTGQTESGEAWLEVLERQVTAVDAVELEAARAAHRRWWEEFWGRSWIFVEGTLASRKMTTNSLPLRIGASSEGGDRFIGCISRARVFGRALKAGEIAALAKGSAAVSMEGVVGDWLFEEAREGVFESRSGGGPAARIVGEVKAVERAGRRCVRLEGDGYLEVGHGPNLALEQACTLEAWIAPERMRPGGGRIIDKSKAGTSNGYLLDTYPGNSLRLITEARTITHDAKLAPGEWVHVAATYDSAGGAARLYINGRQVSSAGSDGDAFVVSRGYALQRWINACGGRGAYPIKFNGSIFTVDAQVGNEHFDGDFRRWGGMYWWQNTRLPYWAMLASGDLELMRPLFSMYSGVLGLCRDKTRIYYGHEGAFFPETMYFWGTNGNCDYGWGHAGPETVNRYIRREWQGGIELTAMMLDYYEIGQDRAFLRESLLPIAEATVSFYERHWGRDASGVIRFEPSQALETWWDCVNPTPEIAGLRHILGRLLELPEEVVGDSRRKAWQEVLGALPAVPLGREGQKRFVLAAEKYKTQRNSENPELYAVWPYRLYGVGKKDPEVGLETWKRRLVKGSVGWRQDAIQAAYLGLSEEAGEYVSGNFSTWDRGSRFPAFWGPNFDWIPDQDHGCVAMTALQRMILQAEGREILLLGGWPRQWDLDFKLWAPLNTIVEGSYRGGVLERLKVTPASRRADVRLISAR